MIGSRFKIAAALLTAAAFLFGGSMAYAASPDVAPSLTFSMLTHQEEGFDASIQIPILVGTGNADLEAAVNARSLEASVALYRDFMSKMAELKAEGSKNYALTAVSKVAAYGDGLLTLEHSRTEAMASSETVVRYETIDLGTGRELALSDPPPHSSSTCATSRWYSFCPRPTRSSVTRAGPAAWVSRWNRNFSSLPA